MCLVFCSKKLLQIKSIPSSSAAWFLHHQHRRKPNLIYLERDHSFIFGYLYRCSSLGLSLHHHRVHPGKDFTMALVTVLPLLNYFRTSSSVLFQTQPRLNPFNCPPLQYTSPSLKPLVIKARLNTRKENPKVRNRRLQRKFNGTSVRPRLSVFCSSKQLYAMLIDDQNKKCLFYGSTLQKAIRENPSCSTAEAAQRVGEELIKACIDLKINEISSYDRNGLARGERMKAFEIAISQHGFLPQ